LKILVLIKSVPDARIPLECAEESGRLIDDWNVPILNPDDAAAIARAFNIKKDIAGTHITAVHLGPISGDRFIREALALGCDEGLRIWEEDLAALHTQGKLPILARAAKILGFDLLFTGNKSLDACSAQMGVLLASALQVPCITRVTGIDAIFSDKVTVTRKLEAGWREQVESACPLIMTMEADEDSLPYASFPDVARAAETTIPCFDLSDIGVSPEAVRQADSRLAFGPLLFPAPKLQYIQPPDSSLPAFDRRRQIEEGSMQKRRGRIVRGDEEEIVEELFQTLLRDGWLDHLRKDPEKV